MPTASSRTPTMLLATTLLPLLPLLAAPAPAGTYDPRTGDLVFHRSTSTQAQAIARATGSPYTHVGVVLVIDDRPLVLEAIEPVSLTPLQTWADRAADGRITIRRLADPALHTPVIRTRLVTAGLRSLGTPYDAAFDWSDDRLYCSELIYKLFDEVVGIEVGGLRPMGDFGVEDPLVQAALQRRYGERIPLDAPVVSPGDQATDEDFATVCSGPVPECVPGTR